MNTFFEEAYSGTPPWDIGRPQPEFVRLAEAGEIRGAVLDVGCGTGEHVLYLNRLGYDVLGIDTAPAAIKKAEEKARRRRATASFLVWDALEMAGLGRRFDTAIDSGLFHVFSDDERIRFGRSLATVLRPAGRYFMLCFSDRQPSGYGPRRVTQTEIRASFEDGWRVDWIRPAAFATREDSAAVQAWLSSITRTADVPS